MNNVQTQQQPPLTGRAQTEHWSPPVDIHESKDAYVLRAEMPGVRKDGLEITIESSTLTIVGRRVAERFEGTVLHRESKGVDYRRVFELDPTIDTAGIHARVEQGVVTVELPKAERVKPRKIKITD